MYMLCMYVCIHATVIQYSYICTYGKLTIYCCCPCTYVVDLVLSVSRFARINECSFHATLPLCFTRLVANHIASFLVLHDASYYYSCHARWLWEHRKVLATNCCGQPCLVVALAFTTLWLTFNSFNS